MLKKNRKKQIQLTENHIYELLIRYVIIKLMTEYHYGLREQRVKNKLRWGKSSCFMRFLYQVNFDFETWNKVTV